MSGVTWLCVIGVALATVTIATGYLSVGIFGLVLNPLIAWYDWREFGTPPSEPHWWNRFGPSPSDDGGGPKVPASLQPRPNEPSGAQALPLPDEG
ncbi:MAG: hypothetical protein QOD92_1810 [Acidimicrobiaceae bacterium]|jgi:hypothetical protein